jgi:hypothetical protein
MPEQPVRATDALQKYNSYNDDEWEKAYFDEVSGGFNVYHKKHHFAKKGGGGNAEKIVGKMLAKYNGKQVEFLPEGEVKSPDVAFDNQTWDIKYVENAAEHRMRNTIREARKADNAIFYFQSDSQYDTLISSIRREVGKFMNNNQIDQLPDIYYINKNGLLELLWEKQKGLTK